MPWKIKIDPADSPDFRDNLKKALNDKDPAYGSLGNDITSMEDVYALKSKKLVADFIRNKLHLKQNKFKKMMDRKMEVDNDWGIVNGLLGGAGQHQRGDPDYRLVTKNATDFAANFKSALNEPNFSAFKAIFEVNGTPDDLDRFKAALQQIEQDYFYCSLEDFALLMDAGKREKHRPMPRKSRHPPIGPASMLPWQRFSPGKN